jgi:hypothetical protein
MADGTRSIRARLAARDRKAAQAFKAQAQTLPMNAAKWSDDFAECDEMVAYCETLQADMSMLMEWDDDVADAAQENVTLRLLLANRWDSWARYEMGDYDYDL